MGNLLSANSAKYTVYAIQEKDPVTEKRSDKATDKQTEKATAVPTLAEGTADPVESIIPEYYTTVEDQAPLEHLKPTEATIPATIAAGGTVEGQAPVESIIPEYYTTVEDQAPLEYLKPTEATIGATIAAEGTVEGEAPVESIIPDYYSAVENQVPLEDLIPQDSEKGHSGGSFEHINTETEPKTGHNAEPNSTFNIDHEINSQEERMQKVGEEAVTSDRVGPLHRQVVSRVRRGTERQGLGRRSHGIRMTFADGLLLDLEDLSGVAQRYA